MKAERTPRTDKELWRSLAAGHGASPGPVSDLDLASWLEGRLPEAAAARVEAAVASDPELRRAALELAELQGGPLPAAPVRMVVRARALIGFDAERQARRGGWFGRMFPSGPRHAFQRSAMVAMSIVVAGVGFVIGGGLGESFGQQMHGSEVAATTAANPSNELADYFTGDEL
mgnify:FL=1|jgi:anti-sigma factor RsiW